MPSAEVEIYSTMTEESKYGLNVKQSGLQNLPISATFAAILKIAIPQCNAISLSPKGPGTKKKPKNDKVRVRGKQKNSLSGHYLHIEMISKGAIGHAENPRDINK